MLGVSQMGSERSAERSRFASLPLLGYNYIHIKLYHWSLGEFPDLRQSPARRESFLFLRARDARAQEMRRALPFGYLWGESQTLLLSVLVRMGRSEPAESKWVQVGPPESK